MKSSLHLPRFSALPFLLVLGLGVGISAAQGQNLINNPGFNSPVSADPSVLTNWAIVYVHGSKDDFAIADRTTWAKRQFGSTDSAGVPWGAQFRPITEGPMHAYFRQVVTNLTPGASYVISGYMFRTWNRPDTIDIYIETVGGTGTVRTSNCNSLDGYGDRYSVTNTAAANGTIEVRLRYNKNRGTVDKHAVSSACYDDISLTRQ